MSKEDDEILFREDITPTEFAIMARRNGWQEKTIKLVLYPDLPRESIRMGPYLLTIKKAFL